MISSPRRNQPPFGKNNHARVRAHAHKQTQTNKKIHIYKAWDVEEFEVFFSSLIILAELKLKLKICKFPPPRLSNSPTPHPSQPHGVPDWLTHYQQRGSRHTFWVVAQIKKAPLKRWKCRKSGARQRKPLQTGSGTAFRGFPPRLRERLAPGQQSLEEVIWRVFGDRRRQQESGGGGKNE